MSPAEEPMPEQHDDAAPVVLVVEDEALIRLATAEHLRSCGFKVIEAATGAEAQEIMLAGLHVDIVFSDITMPGPMDGIAFAKWLHTHEPDLPVVLTSGVPSSLAAAKAACANVHALEHKPYDFDKIVAQLRAHLAPRD